MANCVKKVAKEILGESKGKKFTRRETWWWSKEIQNAIKEKRDYFIAWQKNKNNETLKEYKVARNNTKKLVSEAKSKAFDDLYRKLGTREGEKDIYKLAKQRDKKSKDLDHIRCIKDEDQRVLVKDHEIKGRWRTYFEKLLNGDNTRELSRQGIGESSRSNNNYYFRRIRTQEVEEALRRTKIGKALGPNGILIEVWKNVGSAGIMWLTRLFNMILKERRMPDE